MKKRIANKITKCSEKGGIIKREYKAETFCINGTKWRSKKEPLRYFPYKINQIEKARRIAYRNNKKNAKCAYYITENLVFVPWIIDRSENIEIVWNSSFDEKLIDGFYILK